MAKPGKKKHARREASGRRVTPKKRRQATPPPAIEAPWTAEEPATALARITELEADRANLMAQVAWARGIASEQQKALDAERERTRVLEAEIATQRSRIEALKALGVLDRLLGRHKRV